eukprot:4437518-Lingulodinium_polyedra.AAC.1
MKLDLTVFSALSLDDCRGLLCYGINAIRTETLPAISMPLPQFFEWVEKRHYQYGKRLNADI